MCARTAVSVLYIMHDVPVQHGYSCKHRIDLTVVRDTGAQYFYLDNRRNSICRVELPWHTGALHQHAPDDHHKSNGKVCHFALQRHRRRGTWRVPCNWGMRCCVFQQLHDARQHDCSSALLVNPPMTGRIAYVQRPPGATGEQEPGRLSAKAAKALEIQRNQRLPHNVVQSRSVGVYTYKVNNEQMHARTSRSSSSHRTLIPHACTQPYGHSDIGLMGLWIRVYIQDVVDIFQLSIA